MTAQSILAELEPLGTASYKRVMMNNHGVKEPCFGVKIGDLQKIRKRIKMDYRLALDLYATGNYDAMYLASLIADDARMTKRDLQRWADGAYGAGLPGAVASVAAGSPHGHAMAMKWIDSKKPLIAVTGWATLSSLVSVKPDAELNLAELKDLLKRVQQTIHESPDLVRYQMNMFIIAVGSCVTPLTELALKTAEKIGKVTADMGNNSCEVFSATDYIQKVQKRGTLGKKRKSAKC
ncbi:MAG TPA: DNA alkylation repair protein [Verrucomicrobiae bacterium]